MKKATYSAREWVTFYLLAAVIVGILGFHFVTHALEPNHKHQSTSPTAPTSQVTPTRKTIPIEINETGFTPNTITAKLGDKLVFTNTGKEPHEPGAGPHPSHESYPEFESEHALEPGQTFEYVLIRTGTYSFHDHLNEARTGTITISQ